MCETDEQCVGRCLEGSAEAYRRLVARYEGPLLAYLAGRLGNHSEAVEAAQETFVRAYFALDKLKRRGAFFSWLMGIARRVSSEAIRAAPRRRTVDPSLLESVEAGSESAAESEATLMAAVDELPEKYRQVIVMRFFAGASCPDISRALGIPLGTVTKRLSRAYARLRESLGDEIGQPDAEVRR